MDSARGLCAVFTLTFIFTILNLLSGAEVPMSWLGHTDCSQNQVICFVILKNKWALWTDRSCPKNQGWTRSAQRDTDFHSRGNCLKWQGFSMYLWEWSDLNFSQLLWKGRINFIDFCTSKGKREWRWIIKEPTLVNDCWSFSNSSGP